MTMGTRTTMPLRHGGPVAAAAILLALAACAGRSEESLEQARTSVSAMQNNPQVNENAAVQADQAHASLGRLEAAWEDGEEGDEIEHLAYLTEQRVAIAEAAATEQMAQTQFEELSEEREGVLLGAREEQIATLEEQLQDLQTRQTERGLVITLGDILFQVDRADLQPGGIQQLSRLADYLRDNPDRSILIEGHTDSTGEDAYNLRLSEDRAYAVEDFLISQGVDPRRIASRGYGEQYPLAPNDTASGRQENRRVEIVVPDQGQTPLPRG
jgi:outer membrane protein OmpA-like peptidoglycan-associated protein